MNCETIAWRGKVVSRTLLLAAVCSQWTSGIAWPQETGSPPRTETNTPPRSQEQPKNDPEARGVEVLPVDPAAEDASTYGERHALVIGIDDYEDPDFPDLGYAVADAEGFAQLLIANYAFKKERVRLCRNGEAKKTLMGSALTDWVSDPTKVHPNDFVVIFFAGHGVTESRGGTDMGYLVPADGRRDAGVNALGTMIGMGMLKEEVSALIPAKHVLFILNCCFGGLATDRGGLLPVAPDLIDRARQIITAGGKDQAVEDSGGGGHSLFTGALIDGLSGWADATEDHVITFGELFGFIAQRVESMTEKRQRPLNSKFPDDGGGWVAFFHPDIIPVGMDEVSQLALLTQDKDRLAREKRQLSDVVLSRDLLEEAERLWPRHPSRIEDMRKWLGDARELESRLPTYEEIALRVRQEAYLTQVTAGLIPGGEIREPLWEKADADQRFRHLTSMELVNRIRAMGAMIADIKARIGFASTIEKRSIEDFTKDWDEAINEIALSDKYSGLEITPQLGLVPIGPDPDSGRWEFWHVETGTCPERDAETRKLKLTEDMGLVLVLIPGGSFAMGAVRPAEGRPAGSPNVDPEAQGDEGPVHEIELGAFFLSKYEMTQGQWSGFMHENPSWHQSGRCSLPHSPLTPVDQVSWEDCDRVMTRLGLVLPTEAQWEYAARAGTTTVWWTGNAKESLAESENVGDQSFAKALVERVIAENWDDGFADSAPVGSRRPNPFGLYDISGNLWEWCRDRHLPYSRPTTPGEGRRMQDASDWLTDRVYRGGRWGSPAISTRTADRHFYAPGKGSNALGLRPARVMTE